MLAIAQWVQKMKIVELNCLQPVPFLFNKEKPLYVIIFFGIKYDIFILKSHVCWISFPKYSTIGPFAEDQSGQKGVKLY